MDTHKQLISRNAKGVGSSKAKLATRLKAPPVRQEANNSPPACSHPLFGSLLQMLTHSRGPYFATVEGLIEGRRRGGGHGLIYTDKLACRR